MRFGILREIENRSVKNDPRPRERRASEKDRKGEATGSLANAWARPGSGNGRQVVGRYGRHAKTPDPPSRVHLARPFGVHLQTVFLHDLQQLQRVAHSFLREIRTGNVLTT